MSPFSIPSPFTVVPPLFKGLSRIPYDIEYALRLCSEHHMTKACVHIYCVKELYEEAMDLALKVRHCRAVYMCGGVGVPAFVSMYVCVGVHVWECMCGGACVGVKHVCVGACVGVKHVCVGACVGACVGPCVWVHVCGCMCVGACE